MQGVRGVQGVVANGARTRRPRPRKDGCVDEVCLFTTPGGEPLWRVAQHPRDIRLRACMTPNLGKQAAPVNVSTLRSSMITPGVNKSKTTGRCIALRRSREPPVFTLLGGTAGETNIARVAGYTPKRLPSRRRE